LLGQGAAFVWCGTDAEIAGHEIPKFVEFFHGESEQFHEYRNGKAGGNGGDEFAFTPALGFTEQLVGPFDYAGFERLDRLGFEKWAQ